MISSLRAAETRDSPGMVVVVSRTLLHFERHRRRSAGRFGTHLQGVAARRQFATRRLEAHRIIRLVESDMELGARVPAGIDNLQSVAGRALLGRDVDGERKR